MKKIYKKDASSSMLGLQTGTSGYGPHFSVVYVIEKMTGLLLFEFDLFKVTIRYSGFGMEVSF